MVVIQNPTGRSLKKAAARPAQVDATARATARARDTGGRAEIAWAEAAGATSSEKTRSTPVNWLAPATATARRRRKPAPRTPTGRPAAAATDPSTVAKSNGRLTAATTTTTTVATATRAAAWPAVTPRKLPNRNAVTLARKPR